MAAKLNNWLLTGVNSVKIVQVGGKAKTLDGALDVGLDVGRRVGDAAVAKDVKSALGSDCFLLGMVIEVMIYDLLKTLSRTLCFLTKSPRSFSLTPA